MLKSELVEMAIEAKMTEAFATNRKYWVKRFGSMTKAEVELWLEGFTSGDSAKMDEAHKIENSRKNKLARNHGKMNRR